jgi:hypothetical protein
MATIALGSIGFLSVLAAAYEYRLWQDSKVWMETGHDSSPTAYALTMLAFGMVGLFALLASWLVWSHRHRRQAHNDHTDPWESGPSAAYGPHSRM